MFLTLVTFVVVLGILVLVHEFGHFSMARKFGVKAEEFGFGFPPRVWGIYKSKEGGWKQVRGSREVEDAADTIFSLNWIPIGGFVKIKGEDGGSRDPDSFTVKKIWQRSIILLAGVTMNFILAAVLITAGLMIGLPQALDGVSPLAEVTSEQIQIIEVLSDSPAKQAGVKLGDIIASIDNINFTESEALQDYVDARTGEELNYIFKRGNTEIPMTITPEVREETGKGGIGVAIADTGLVSYPWYLAIWEGLKTTVFLTWAIIAAFFNLIKGIIIGQGISADIAGPVGIAAITGQVARMGFVYILQFTALLSINLAIINALPFPALDGGRFIFLLIEKVKGSPVKREVEAVIHNIGFALLMLLVLIVTFKDVARFGDTFKLFWDKLF